MGRNYTVGNVFDWQGIHVKGGGLNWAAGEMGVRYMHKYIKDGNQTQFMDQNPLKYYILMSDFPLLWSW